MTGRDFHIEDRTKRASFVFKAGSFVVWEVVVRPLPCRLYRGSFATIQEARDFIKQERRGK